MQDYFDRYNAVTDRVGRLGYEDRRQQTSISVRDTIVEDPYSLAPRPKSSKKVLSRQCKTNFTITMQ